MYWEKIPFSFEKRIRAEIGKCVDDESLSNPVRYRLIGEGDAPTGAWTENQEVEITIEALAIEDVIGTIILDDTVVSYPGGTVVRIPLNATGLIAGMTVVFINGWPVPNNVVIAAVDPNFQWIEIDWGWSDPYEPIRFPNNSRMLFGKIREDNWSSDPAANYKFACQAKDNATPQNVGLPSEFAQVAAPDEWPMDIWINL